MDEPTATDAAADVAKDATAKTAGKPAGGDAPRPVETSAAKPQEAPAEQEKTLRIGKRDIPISELLKLGGLVVFFVAVALTVVLAWPSLREIFEEGGVELLVQRMRDAGPLGVLILLGLQLLQVIVAFIPGEVVQIAAGALYGPVGGTLVVLAGAAIASAIVFEMVHFLGAPFVRSMAPEGFMDKFEAFEESGKLNIIVFLLFLIPGLPKDVFTYLVGLTNMKLSTFLIISILGRTPGVFVSAFAASKIMKGDYLESAIMFGVLALIAGVVIIFRDRIMERFSK